MKTRAEVESDDAELIEKGRKMASDENNHLFRIVKAGAPGEGASFVASKEEGGVHTQEGVRKPGKKRGISRLPSDVPKDQSLSETDFCGRRNEKRRSKESFGEDDDQMTQFFFYVTVILNGSDRNWTGQRTGGGRCNGG